MIRMRTVSTRRCRPAMAILLLVMAMGAAGCCSAGRRDAPLQAGEIERVAGALALMRGPDPNNPYNAAFAQMSAREMDLTVRALAALYWDEARRARAGIESSDPLIDALGRSYIDRALDEVLLIAQHSSNVEDVESALSTMWLKLRRSVEHLPVYLAISAREELPEELRRRARYRAAFSPLPLTVGEVRDELEISGIFRRTTTGSERDELFRKIDEDLVELNLAIWVGNPATYQAIAERVRRSRYPEGTAPSVALHRQPPADVRAVLERLGTMPAR